MDTVPLSSDDPTNVLNLYISLISAWNHRNVEAFAACFADDANMVGFDGSVVDGRPAIHAHLNQIFADHMTAVYVGKVRETRLLTPGVVLLRAVVGMIPPGKSDINPAANAIQSLVAVAQDGLWRAALFHNTPAQFHGRPELAEALTRELRALIGEGG